MNDWLLLGLVTMAMFVIFAAAWAWGKSLHNYSLVDACWAFGIGLSGLVFTIFGTGDLSKRTAAAGLAVFWGGRLGHHLQKRIRKHHPKEDSRYTELRKTWNDRQFLGFFEVQALSVILLAMPYFLVSRDSSPWGIWESIGIAVALIGIIGETLSDHQMSKFKAANPDPKAVCKTGLWRYSRHPNYFFEMVIWIGIFLFACGSAYGWVTAYAPAAITFLLLKVTGIPPTEASAVNRKGTAYLEYQRTTSPFIPLPPKE